MENEEMRKKFGEIIKERRQFKNVSRRELAEHMGVSEACIGFWERGQRKISLEQMGNIADYLNFSVSDFYDEIDTIPDDAKWYSKYANTRFSKVEIDAINNFIKKMLEDRV